MRKKLLLLLFVVVIIGTSITSLLTISLIKNEYINQLEKSLYNNSIAIKSFINTNPSNDKINRFVEDFYEETNIRLTFIDSKGYVLYDSKKDVALMDNHLNRPEISEIEENSTYIRYSNSINQNMLYSSFKLEEEEHSELKYIRLSVSLEYIDNIYSNYIRLTLLSALIGILISFILGFRFINKLVEPIKRLSVVTKNISEGELNQEVIIYENDEIGDLGVNFNNMSKILKKSFDEIKESNKKMEVLLENIQNPILSIDKYKKIVLFNRSAEDMFFISSSDVKGKHILQIIKNYHLDEKIDLLFDNNNNFQLDISIKIKDEYKYLRLNANIIRVHLLDNDSNLGAVISIEDLTEIKKLETMRSDFVANVSHELKTPLTSIKGFVDTLEDGAKYNEEYLDKFLKIINIEVERLSRLINDTLKLSSIENPINISFDEDIDIKASILESQKILQPLSESKKVEFKYNIENNLEPIKGNIDWFKQMMINLLENAIKYNKENGSVEIIVYQNEQFVVIIIKDTGIGIASDKIDRLFERFYRVDKGRSSKEGGTGLGLAITKHIIKLFNGDISVSSKLGVGSSFKLKIPKKTK